jgi:hypothetical protein
LAWGVVEGHLVTLRSEISNSEFYFPRYLLLATRSSDLRDGIERDFGSIANQLTYLEFTIGLEVRSIYRSLDPLATRSGLWGGTLDDIADVTGEAADLLASAGRNHINVISRRLTRLNMVVRRLATFIEKGASDSYEIERKYTGFIDGTDDFMRRQFTESAVPRIEATDLRHALLNAYPYQYVKEAVKAGQSTMRDLLSSVERSGRTVESILEPADRQSREALALLGRWVGALVTLLALVVGLLQVFGQQTAAINSPATRPYKGFIDKYLSWLPNVTPVVFAALGALLVIAALVYIGQWIIQALPHRRHQFIEQVQRLRAMVDAADALLLKAREAQQPAPYLADLEQLDVAASALLASLWDDLRAARKTVAEGLGRVKRTRQGPKVRVPGVRDWEFKARTLEHKIELFDLAPRRVALPRALCLLRFKSSDFFSRSTISTDDFVSSLRAIGMATEDIRRLEQWLTTPENQFLIRGADAGAFVRALQAYHVSVIGERRDPNLWQGPLQIQL